MAQSDGSGSVIVICGLVMLYFLAPDKWSNAVWYGVDYKVGFNKVTTDPKPKDCDFMHAPLGNKECSYSAHVKAYNANDGLVAGEGAPKYGHDTKTGRPIFSFDNGKSWEWYSGSDLPSTAVAYVKVYWEKEKD